MRYRTLYACATSRYSCATALLLIGYACATHALPHAQAGALTARLEQLKMAASGMNEPITGAEVFFSFLFSPSFKMTAPGMNERITGAEFFFVCFNRALIEP